MTKENAWLPLSVPNLFLSLNFVRAQHSKEGKGNVRGDQNQGRYYYFIQYLILICLLFFLKVNYSLDGKESSNLGFKMS